MSISKGYIQGDKKNLFSVLEGYPLKIYKKIYTHIFHLINHSAAKFFKKHFFHNPSGCLTKPLNQVFFLITLYLLYSSPATEPKIQIHCGMVMVNPLIQNFTYLKQIN